MGIKEKIHKVYLIDFGLTKKFASREGYHIEEIHDK